MGGINKSEGKRQMDVVASGRSKHPGMDRDMKRDNVTRNQQTYSWTAPGRGMEIGTGKCLSCQ
jgi:hypothetical protein